MRLSHALLAFLLLSPAAVQAQDTADLGSVTLSFRPPNAQVFIDGERWVTPELTGPLVVQLPPGRHLVEVRAPGYRPYSSIVEVRRGETTPINVILPEGPAAPRFDPGLPPSPAGPIQQVSRKPSGDGFVFATDFKITELNHRTTGFAGFYGGAVFAGQFLIGGGAYFQLTDYYNHYDYDDYYDFDSPSEEMVYGGLVSEWRLFHDHPVGLTLHGLAGYGQARIGYIAFDGEPPHAGPRHGGGYYGYGYPFAYEGFFVGEPSVQVVARFGPGVRLVGGVGYRFTSSDFSSLNGVSGTIGIQIGR